MKRIVLLAVMVALFSSPVLAGQETVEDGYTGQWVLYDDFNEFHEDDIYGLTCGFDNQRWVGVNSNGMGKKFDQELINVRGGYLEIASRVQEGGAGYSSAQGLGISRNGSYASPDITGMRVPFNPIVGDDYNLTYVTMPIGYEEEGNNDSLISVSIRVDNTRQARCRITRWGKSYWQTIVERVPSDEPYVLSIDYSDGETIRFILECGGEIYEATEPMDAAWKYLTPPTTWGHYFMAGTAGYGSYIVTQIDEVQVKYGYAE